MKETLKDIGLALLLAFLCYMLVIKIIWFDTELRSLLKDLGF